ncbi:class IIb bacteriocin, lactobin A/cerein 7B family [Massilia violaceinigra]|uniref:Class IIb bacteriocin, lactobin A/cerein 7B family n=1 Tax=Massilia violaceinigra TaxID=2045208 RepID=A0ABY4AG28_9BURK|nr:class IIb bacteriocin, lactobin A/cerein 7B family [Massilia violaceinigra]UOD32609.1 class IIb bacteriocin, lactobin A/cerein 7B family [Massilia violaceinigra]
MQSFCKQELSDEEIKQVAGGVPVPLIVVGGIFVVGMIAGACTGYKEEARKREKSEKTDKGA